MSRAERIILAVLFSSNSIYAMEQASLPQAPLCAKIHLRVIARDKNSAKRFADDFDLLALFKSEPIFQQYLSSCGLMRAYLGDRDSIEKCIRLLETWKFVCLSHDQGANYERFIFTDSPAFLGCSAYLTDKQKPIKVSLSRKRSVQEMYEVEPLKVWFKRHKKGSEQNSSVNMVQGGRAVFVEAIPTPQS